MQIEATQHKRITVTIDPEQTIYEMLTVWKSKIGVPVDAHLRNGLWYMPRLGMIEGGHCDVAYREAIGNEEEIYNAFRLVALNV